MARLLASDESCVDQIGHRGRGKGAPRYGLLPDPTRSHDDGDGGDDAGAGREGADLARGREGCCCCLCEGRNPESPNALFTHCQQERWHERRELVRDSSTHDLCTVLPAVWANQIVGVFVLIPLMLAIVAE